MNQQTELQRIDQLVDGERPHGPVLEVVALVPTDAELSLRRVKEVIRIVAAQDPDQESWPNDDDWTRLLPEWFTAPFVARTIDDVLANDQLWDYGSWLDAMRQRGWEWWSSAPAAGDCWTAYLLRLELVYSIEPLQYLILASGASKVDVREL